MFILIYTIWYHADGFIDLVTRCLEGTCCGLVLGGHWDTLVTRSCSRGAQARSRSFQHCSWPLQDGHNRIPHPSPKRGEKQEDQTAKLSQCKTLSLSLSFPLVLVLNWEVVTWSGSWDFVFKHLYLAKISCLETPLAHDSLKSRPLPWGSRHFPSPGHQQASSPPGSPVFPHPSFQRVISPHLSLSLCHTGLWLPS